MKSFGILNLILTILLFLAITILSIVTVIHKDFKSLGATFNFLENANVYTNLADIAKIEIQNHYPPRLKNNILEETLADRLVDSFITPGLVERIMEPSLKFSVVFANAPTMIISDKVVIDTTQYKQEASDVVVSWDLPKIFTRLGNTLISSVPTQLQLVDLSKHPNSPLGWIIKARTLLHYNAVLLNITWAFIIAILAILIIHNIVYLKRLFLSIWIAFISSSLLILVLYFGRVSIVSMFLPESTDQLISAQNNLVSDILYYLIRQLRHGGLLYLVIGVVFFVLWKILNFQKLDKKVARFLHRAHIPVVSIKLEQV